MHTLHGSSSQLKAHISPTSPRHIENNRPNSISKGHFISEMSITSTKMNDSPFHIGITVYMRAQTYQRTIREHLCPKLLQ